MSYTMLSYCIFAVFVLVNLMLYNIIFTKIQDLLNF